MQIREPHAYAAPFASTLSKPRAVVIGAGFGGLAAAIRLSVRGYDVTVLDKLDQPGGRACVHRQDGFVFDAGPTVVTAPFLFEELWQLCGKNMADDVDLRAVTPFYRIRFADGTWFNYSGDPDAMRREVQRVAPGDVEGYEAFVRMSESIFDVGFTRLAHVPFGAATDMLRIIPDMLRLKSYRTVFGLVSQYVRDERLRQVLSFHPLLVGGNPFSTTSIYTLILYLERRWGVFFPMGGTGSLVKGLVQLIEGQGSRVRLNAPVDKILVEGNTVKGVRLCSGEVLPSEIVVSNADAAWTYRHLVANHVKKVWTPRRLDKMRYSMSLFVWYFGTRRTYPDVAHHSILLGPRYKGLLNDIFERKVLADDFSLYLHRPTATDPSLAPPGCDAFYVLSPVPHLDANVAWHEVAAVYKEKIAAYLEQTCLPELRQHIASERLLTPQNFLDNYWSLKGAAFGLEPVLTQSAYFRPHNASEDIKNLFLVGAGTHPGAGMPGVLSSARVLDSVVPDAAQLAKPLLQNQTPSKRPA